MNIALILLLINYQTYVAELKNGNFEHKMGKINQIISYLF